MVPSMLILLTTGRLGIFSRLGGFQKKVPLKTVPRDNIATPAA